MNKDNRHDNHYIVISNKQFSKELSREYMSKIDDEGSLDFLPFLDDKYFYYINNKNICQNKN